MSERVVYLNGSLVPEDEAKVSVFDRGFTSGDAVYEVTRSFAHSSPLIKSAPSDSLVP